MIAHWRVGVLRIITLASLIVLAGVAVLGFIIGTEPGTRWFLEKALREQGRFLIEKSSGRLWDGVRLASLHWHARKFDLYAQDVDLRWSLSALYRGQLPVSWLSAEHVELDVPVAPVPQETHLVSLWIPFELRIRQGELRDVSLVRGSHRWDATALRLTGGSWLGSSTHFEVLSLTHPYFEIALAGRLKLTANYPLEGAGLLHVPSWEAMGVSPWQLELRNDLADLQVMARSAKGVVPAALKAHLHTLKPHMPLQVEAAWKDVQWPWPPAQALRSRHGRGLLTGSLLGYRCEGEMDATGRYLPEGEWRWVGSGNWKNIEFSSLNFSGQNGSAVGAGGVSWSGHQISWRMQAQMHHVDLARRWPQLHWIMPVAIGHWQSNGLVTIQGSDVDVKGEGEAQEQWQMHWHSPGWVWRLDLPYEADLRWRHVRRRLGNWTEADFDEGHAVWEGPFDKHAFKTRTTVSSQAFPEGELAVEGDGHGKAWQVRRWQWVSEAGAIDFAGSMGYRQGWWWDGQVEARDVDPSYLAENWPGALRAQAHTQGRWSENEKRLSVVDAQIDGPLREKPLSALGTMTWQRSSDRRWQWQVQGLRAAWAGNELKADGGILDHWDLHASAKVPDLEALWPDWQGAAQGELDLNGEPATPNLRSYGAIERLQGHAISVERLDWSGSLAGLGEAPGEFQVSATHAVFHGQPLESFKLGAQGTLAHNRLRWQLQSPYVEASGELAGSLGLDGSWSGQAEAGQARVASRVWKLASPFEVAWHMPERSLLLAPHCWAQDSASLCAENDIRLGKEGYLRMQLTNLDTGVFAPLMPSGMEWRGQVDGEVEAKWQENSRAELRLAAFSHRGALRVRQESGLAVDLPYDRVGVNANLLPEGVEVQAEISSEMLGDGSLNVTINPQVSPFAMAGQLHLNDVNLAPWRPLVPALYELAGSIDASGELAGTTHDPLFFGDLRLRRGHFLSRQGELAAEDVTADAHINGRVGHMDARLKHGDGAIQIAADAHWGSETFQANGHLSGRNYVIHRPPVMSAELSPELDFMLQPGLLQVSGKVEVPKARLVMKNSVDKAVDLSPDVVIGSFQQAPENPLRSWQLIASIDVILGDEVMFTGFDASGRLMGQVHLQQDGRGVLAATGEVNLDPESSFRAYGQSLRIRRGRLLFAGPVLQPQLDIEAVKDIDNKTVGVRVDGWPSQPQSRLISDNQLSQDEIASYLIFGHALERQPAVYGVGGTATASAGSLLNQPGGNSRFAAVQIGALGGQQVADNIGSSLGVRDLSLSTEGAGEDTRVALGGYVAPNLFLSYGVGVFNPVNSLTLRYRISNSFYLQAVSAIENAIDVFYTWKF